MSNAKKIATDRRTFMKQAATTALLTNGIISCAGEKAAEEQTGKGKSPFKWRVIRFWRQPEGLHKQMLNTDPNSTVGRAVAQCRDWGFNIMGIVGNPDNNPEAWANFARYLKSNGIGLMLYRVWSEPDSVPRRQGTDNLSRVSEKLCPYNEETRAYWRERITKDFTLIPDLAALRMGGTEFYINNGAPWMCDCDECKKHTPRERTIEAITFIADLLNQYGAKLFWQTWQDDPVGQRHETDYFGDLTGDIPENAFAVMKYRYWDFHPRWPRHPLFYTLTKDKQGKCPYLSDFQQAGEYLGWSDFPWSMVDEWSQAYREVAESGQQGIWISGLIDPRDWDHPLNFINWHAISRYMDDPYADPSEIKLEWASQEFGSEAAPTVVEMIDKITEAGRGMYEFDAMWTASHSFFPSLEYLDCHVCGPYRDIKRIKGMMGMDLPLDMYPAEQAAKIKANPQTRLVFNKVPITPQLKAEAMAQKDGAVTLMEDAISLWKSLKGKIDEEKYNSILSGLEANLNDTIVFRHMMDIYMDWKLGVLTEAKIDAALDACSGLKGRIVPEPLAMEPKKKIAFSPATLKTFAEKLRKDLREPWMEDFWKKNPRGLI